ncbi:hypothetical protein AcW1_005238 [Taiwanofungus camphoratus]|nr:hypothetical protein AcW2_004008 [Antrodia cinnamomea]KAI0948790.1 hypothetical protein AcV7_009443 [Antrodia cinnamomea]KAI0956600.1 hypothetical protein AcW1_005238 [Antrodia cinnamomea]
MSQPSHVTLQIPDFDIYADLPIGPLDFDAPSQDSKNTGAPVILQPNGLLFPTTENPLQAYPFYQPQYEQVPHDALASSHQWYYHPTLPVAYSHIPSYPHVHNATHSAEVLDYVYSPVPQRPSTSGVQSIPLSAPSRVHVPQTIQVVPKATASYTVGFGAQGCRGVRVSDALKDCVVLDGGDDRVFASIGVRQIRLVVAWPGYDHFGTYIAVQDKNGFITRTQLAKFISLHITRFTDKAMKTRVAHGHAQWTIGKRGILLENIWLVSVGPARSNIWLTKLEIQM